MQLFFEKRNLISAAFWSIFLCIVLFLYRLLTLNGSGSIDTLLDFSKIGIGTLLIFTIILIFSFISLLLIFNNKHAFNQFLYKWRWVIAFFLFLILTTLNISGSSIGIWGAHLPNGSNPDLLLGTSRPIRSDEWAILTPQIFSQFADQNNFLQYFSDIPRATSTDMNIYYQAPMWDIAQLFRPFQVGYLFLGAERGLSFWWNSRLIFLFMISFEFGMLFTKKNKILSIVLAISIAFSPAIQWWYGASYLPDIIVWGEASILLIVSFLTTDSIIRKLIYALGMVVTFGSYIATLYLSWLIPFSYVFMALLIIEIINLRKQNLILFRPLKDSLILLAALFLLVFAYIYILLKSWGTITALLDSHQSTREVVLGKLSNIAYSSFYPYYETMFFKDANLTTNPCNLATFYDLFPLGLILAIAIQLHNKKFNYELSILLVIFIILGIFCYLPIPYEPIRKLFIFNATTVRVLTALSFINLLLLIKSISLTLQKESKVNRSTNNTLAAICLAFIIMLFGYYGQQAYPTSYITLFCSLMLVFGLFSFMQRNLTLILAFTIISASFYGLLVNPVQVGGKALLENDLFQQIKQISEQEEGDIWIADNKDLSHLPQMLIAAGAPTVNSVNVYPNTETWQKIDESNQFKNIWNRYGYFDVELTTQPTSFEAIADDHVLVHLNYNDLAKLNVNYVLTADDDFDKNSGLDAHQVYDTESFGVWKLLE